MGRCTPSGALSNMYSAVAHPEVVDRLLSSELKTGRVCGPVSPELVFLVDVNRFGQHGAADALSRNDLFSSQRLVPGASEATTVLPEDLLDVLVRGTPDWTSIDRTTLFSRTT